MRGDILPVDWATLVTVNVGINTNGRVRGATNIFLNGYNYSSQPEPSFCRNSFGIYEGGGGDITSLFYVFHFTTRARAR